MLLGLRSLFEGAPGPPDTGPEGGTSGFLHVQKRVLRDNAEKHKGSRASFSPTAESMREFRRLRDEEALLLILIADNEPY